MHNAQVDPVRDHGSPLLASLLVLALLLSGGEAGAVQLGIKRFEAPVAAPPLALADLDGRRHQLDEFKGRVLVVNFWATWCLPCRLELPAMERAAAALEPHGVSIITVAMGQDVDEVRELLPVFDFNLPKLVDPDSEVSLAWRVQTLPTSYVVDPSGRLVMRVVGNYDWTDPGLWKELRGLSTGD